MKKIFTLLFSLTVLYASAFARPDSTICNPEFTFTVDNAANTVQFAAVVPNTSILLEHHWDFGNGQNYTSPYMTTPFVFYPDAGSYNVKHVVTYRSPNDSTIVICSDSAIHTVVIANRAPCNIDASFSFIRDSIQPNKVYFTNLSSGTDPNTITYWSFGDGTSSYDQNPTHIFTTSGAYTVCLNVKRDNVCMDDTCVFVQVQAPTGNCNNLVVNFSSLSDSANPRLVHFYNQSTPFSPTDSVTWHFGDGTISHDLTAAHHTYANSGTYNVCLVVKKNGNSTGAACVREYCRQITIEPACNLVASFTYQPAIITVPLSYTFTNTSAPLHNVDSSFWNFGDGTPVIINPNNSPTHTYRAPGVYVVCLTVKKVQPGTINIICERQTCQTIIVDTPQTQCNLQAYFIYAPDTTAVNKIYFANMSSSYEPSDSLLWTFGDGSYSTEVSPEHTYNTGGTYTVCLRIERQQAAGTAPCVREYCKQVLVQQPASCNLVANFFDSVINNNTHYFINQSTPLAATDSIRWTFGDGTSSTDINAVHTFNQPGIYNVCLRIKKAQTSSTAPCVREYCRQVLVQQPASCNLVANFFDSSINNNTIYFINQSTPLASTDSIRWTFGDGTSSTDVDAIHTYSQPGTYTVCLRVKKAQTSSTAPCVREICHTVVVSNPSNVCDQLQVNFSWHADSFNNRKINFHNESSPLSATTYSIWTFGDGTSSTALNPEHIYTQPGTYTACLKIGILNEPCFKDTCQTIVVLPGGIDSCNFQPGFITHIDSANRRKVLFSNTTAAPTAAAFAVWSFGDGTSSTGWNADHIYTAPGWYLVCLTVRSGNNTTCTRTYCDSLFVPGNVIPPYNCDSFQLNFGYRRDDYMPNKLFFFATGNAPVYNQQWTFTNNANGSPITVNQNNPVYVFPDTGSYRVCVRAAFSTNCIKENCDWIRINTTTVPTQCVLNSYPNPASSIVTFNVHLDQAGIIAATVLNMQGVTLMQYTQTGFAGNNPVTLNIQNLAPGFYTVRIMYGGRVCYTRFQKI